MKKNNFLISYIQLSLSLFFVGSSAVVAKILINTLPVFLSIGISLIIGVLLIFLTVIFGSLFSVMAKFLSKDVKPFTIASFGVYISGLLFLPFFINQVNYLHLINLSNFLFLIYYGLFVTVIAFLLWFNGLEKVSISTTGVFNGILPVSSTLLSYLILREQFRLIHFLGIVFVVISLFIIYKDN